MCVCYQRLPSEICIHFRSVSKIHVACVIPYMISYCSLRTVSCFVWYACFSFFLLLCFVWSFVGFHAVFFSLLFNLPVISSTVCLSFFARFFQFMLLFLLISFNFLIFVVCIFFHFVYLFDLFSVIFWSFILHMSGFPNLIIAFYSFWLCVIAPYFYYSIFRSFWQF